MHLRTQAVSQCFKRYETILRKVDDEVKDCPLHAIEKPVWNSGETCRTYKT